MSEDGRVGQVCVRRAHDTPKPRTHVSALVRVVAITARHIGFPDESRASNCVLVESREKLFDPRQAFVTFKCEMEWLTAQLLVVAVRQERSRSRWKSTNGDRRAAFRAPHLNLHGVILGELTIGSTLFVACRLLLAHQRDLMVIK